MNLHFKIRMESADSTGGLILELKRVKAFRAGRVLDQIVKSLIGGFIKSSKRITSDNALTIQRLKYLTKIRLFNTVTVLTVEMLISDLLIVNVQITPGFRGFWFGNEWLNVVSKKTFHNHR